MGKPLWLACVGLAVLVPSVGFAFGGGPLEEPLPPPAVVTNVPTKARATRRAAVLIPGTLNELMPGSISLGEFPNLHQKNPYYSEAIVRQLTEEGFETYVVRGLEWCGQLEANGDQTLREIRNWYHERFPKADVPLTLFAHSAGGFYALHAMSQAPDLPIKQLYMLSTPLHGARLANNVVENPWIGGLVEDAVDKFAGIFDLRGLTAMSTGNTAKFISKLRIPASAKVYAIGATQPTSWNPLDLVNPDYLAPGFIILSQWIGAPSDGVVELSSALGTGVEIPSTVAGKPVEIQALPELHMNLDHIEQFLDYRFFAIIGTQNRERIRDEQVRVFGAMAKEAFNAL